jgi:O-antigen/teichoic acid export membrane protein
MNRIHQTKEKPLMKQVPLNLVSNILLFIFNILIWLWLIPYLIKNLGVAGYGLIPLAAQLTNYVGLITVAINSAVSRYLTLYLQRKDYLKSNKVFNTAFFSLSVLLIALVPLLLYFCKLAPTFFDVPADLSQDAFYFFIAFMGMFLLDTFRSNFSVSPFALNRLDIRNVIDIAILCIRVVAIVLLFNVLSPRLIHVGLGYFMGAIVGLILSIWIWKRLTPQLHISKDYYSHSFLKEIASTSGWLVVNQVGSLLFLSIDLIVVNKLFGAAAGGEYATILQWSNLLRSMAGTLAGVLTPVIITLYARRQIEQLINVSKASVKFMGMGMALPIGLMCGFAPSLLSLWLGQEFVELVPLLWLMLFHLVINLSVLPLFYINVATDSVKTPGLVTLAMGIGNICLAIALPLLFGWGYYGVAAAGAIALTLKNAIFTPWYASRILGIDSGIFNRSMAPGCISVVLIFIISAMAEKLFVITNWWLMIGLCACIGLVYLGIAWKIVLSPSEREFFKSFLPSQMKSFIEV